MRIITETCELDDGHRWCSATYCQCYCHGDKNSKSGINEMQLKINEARGGKEWQHVDNRHY